MAPDVLNDLRAKLRDRTPFYAEHCLRIVDKRAKLVPLVPRPAQLKLEAALSAQREAGKPMRAIVLKSRKTGISTYVQGMILQRISQRPFRNAIVVAQDTGTAGELFEISVIMHANLPADPTLGIKPQIRNQRNARSMVFGEPSREARQRGDLGLNSRLRVDTAKEFEAGRGYTYTDVHASEVAFWPDTRKMLALLNAVPDEPETLIVLESTANGYNHFKETWDRAERGESDYAPVFISWLEDPDCALAFDSDVEREEFAADIVGSGALGEDEEDLLETHGATLEQLHWRRWAVANKLDGSLDNFHQEYPTTPEEAFLSTGRQVFDRALVGRILEYTRRETDPPAPSQEVPGPELGIVREKGLVARKGRHGTFDVATGAEWVPKGATGFGRNHPFWRIWEHPDPGDKEAQRPRGAYIVSIDPMSGEETEQGELAWHAIQVIDHRSKRQMAEYRSRIDPDLIAWQALLIGLYFNEATIVVETTGGYGLSIVRKLYFDFHYRMLYRRKAHASQREKQQDRLGWSTDRATKPLLEDGGRELLRACDETPLIRSRLLAGECMTYVKDEKGKTGPEPGAFSDLLMAFLIGEQVALELFAPTEKKPKRTTSTRKTLYAKAGY